MSATKLNQKKIVSMCMRNKLMTIFRVLTIVLFFALSKIVYQNYNHIIPDNVIVGMAAYMLVLCLMIALSNFLVGKVYDKFTHKS